MAVDYTSPTYIRGVNKDLQEEIDVCFDNEPAFYPKIAKEITVPDGKEESIGLQGIYSGGIAMPNKVAIGEEPEEVNILDGYQYSIEFDWYGQAIPYYRRDKMNTKKNLDGLLDTAKAFAIAQKRRVDKEFFDLFNNGKTIIGPDGVALFNASHPVVSDLYGGGSTWSNLLTSKSFSKDNFWDARYQLKAGQKGLDGYKKKNRPSTLLVPDRLESEAIAFKTSEKDPDSANNESNIYKGFDVVTCGELTDGTTAANSTWYLLGAKDEYDFCLVWRLKPEVKLDFDTAKQKYVAYLNMYFGVGVKHPYGVLRCEA